MFKGQIPFDKRTGSLRHFAYGKDKGYAQEDIFWKDNLVLPAMLKFHNFLRGRSAAFAVLHIVECPLKEFEGIEVSMFLTDIMDILQRGDISEGLITGNWEFTKKGMNYGIKLHVDS